MQKDIRATTLFREAEALYTAIRRPGTGQISDAAELHVSADGKRAVFAGTIVDKLQGSLPTRICDVELHSGTTRILTFGPNTDRLPKYSPTGSQIAFLSDRGRTGNFQLYLLDAGGTARPAPPVEGWVEYLHWSPDGERILLGVAGHGADTAGTQGAVTSATVAGDEVSWMPIVESGDETYLWRRAWIYDLSTNLARPVSSNEQNIWEAVWCGNDAVAAVVSPEPSEGLWYRARLNIIAGDTGASREIYAPKRQLGYVSASPSGSCVAVVEAICSDRGQVAGDLLLLHTSSNSARRIATQGVDITYTEWCSDQHLLLAGHRGFETVVGLYDAASGTYIDIWSSAEVTTGGIFATISGCDVPGDCVLIGESFARAPEIALIRHGKYHAVKCFDLGYGACAKAISTVERVTWRAPDGLEIQGWLLLPKAKAPFPMVLNVHGGPVWHWRPRWLGRVGLPTLMLVERGYAVFLPNPRGSSGRGQEFAQRVLGDLGGADTLDHLSGLEFLVNQGVADPDRLGVTGSSYGGFMAAWLITQDPRFAAAIPVTPHTNQVSEHLTSNIPQFLAMFLDDHYTNPDGKYFKRSPIMHAHKTKTPTLNICGLLDRCTPPEEAVQFHNALRENGVKSILVTYPEEGHGVRQFPAAIDYAARVVAWFEEHLPLGEAGEFVAMTARRV
jgi:dipeptidyl aminopeptidase/acylaminoacyl peptidase